MVKLTEEIEKDLAGTEAIVHGTEKNKFGCARIYYKSNENLEKLFNCFDVKDKKVLTVLASSDQAFCAYYNGAKSVDTFDINKLAKHYYYLRKWLLTYRGELFPSKGEITLSNKWIFDLLSLVRCSSKDEELSYSYWYSYVMKISGGLGKKLFILGDEPDRIGITDVQRLLSIIEDKELSFRHQDICEDIITNDKYNTIILSNILEYNKFDRHWLRKCRDNLYNILEDNGEVICTNWIYDLPFYVQHDVFMEKFDFEPFGFGNCQLGYCYRKR